jgi:hypothetical protein
MLQKDVAEYGFYGLNHTPSLFMGQIQLPPPALNITAFYLDNHDSDNYNLPGHDWVHPITGQKPFQDPANMTYMLSRQNRTYNLAYIQNYSRCQPSSDVSTVP